MRVSGLWIGPIGTMERMCINSYVRAGHEFSLYRYKAPTSEEYEHLPLGCHVRDANEIVPESHIADFPWASIFSDFFRYALLRAKGGWWVDMDTLCLRALPDPGEDHVFARDNIDQYYVSGCFLHAPLGSPLIEEAYTWINGMSKEDRDKLGHMDIGPYLIQRLVPKYQFEKYVADKWAFDPIPWDKITRIVQTEYTLALEDSIAQNAPYAVHLRQSIWNEGPNSCAGILPNGKKIMTDDEYPADALWSILRRKFL